MAVNASDSAAQRYENNTDGSEWLQQANTADIDGDDWVEGLDEYGVDNMDQVDGSVWANEFEVSQEDASEYDSNTTAGAWAEGWGDASNWDV